MPLQDKPKRHHTRGEYCIIVYWDWRVEKDDTVLFGSSNNSAEIDQNLAHLQGATITSLELSGKVPELTVNFIDGQCLKSMIMVSGHPQWNIRLANGMYLFYEEKTLWCGEGLCLGLTPEEEAMAVLAETTCKRWGCPVSNPKGECGCCQSFIRLAGSFHFLDYGVCIEKNSPLDGRIVNCQSGCPEFKAEE